MFGYRNVEGLLLCFALLFGLENVGFAFVEDEGRLLLADLVLDEVGGTGFDEGRLVFG